MGELSTVTAKGACTDARLQTFTVNGEETPRDGSGAFEKAVFLSSGAWGTWIEFTAEDEYRNVTTVTRTVEVAPLEVQIASPQDGEVLDATSVTVTGTVKGPRDAEVFVNGQRAERNGESFTLASLPLTEGGNVITAHAQTPGDAAESTISVVRDTIAPAVTIEVPDSVDIFDALSVDVAGRVDDPTVQSVTVNGVEAHLYGSYFVAVAVPLNADGPCQLAAEAADAAGHTGQGSVTVTRDTEPPDIEITSPGNGETFRDPRRTVSGTVWDATLYDVHVNGVPAEIDGETFTAENVPLDFEGQNTLTAVARDRVGRQSSHSVTVIRNLPPAVKVDDVIFSPLSNEEVLRVTILGMVDDPSATVEARNETYPFFLLDGERQRNEFEGENANGHFVVDGVVVVPGLNHLRVWATDELGRGPAVEVVVEVTPPAGGYGQGQTPEPPYAILTVAVFGAAGEGGGEKLAGGETFTTFETLAGQGNQSGISVPDKGEETNVFVGTRLRFSVQASACNAEFVSATLPLGSRLVIVNNGNANPHAKRSATVTEGDYTEDGKTYVFEGFWWEAVATTAGSWGDVRATAVLVVNTDPPTDPPPTIDVDSNALSGNNDAVTGVSFEVPGSPYTGWVLKGGSGDSIQVLISKGAPGSVGVKATVTTAMGLLTDQVSWFRNGEYAGQGRVLEWSLDTPDPAYEVIAFGNAENDKEGNGPQGPYKTDKVTGKPKPEPSAGESAVTIKVDAGYGNVLGWRLRDPVAPSNHFTFPVGEQAKASLVLEDFSSIAPLPQVQGWYLLPVDVPAGLCPLDISEVESGHNHSGSTTVTLNGISPGTVNVFVAIQPPGVLLTTLPYCVLLGAQTEVAPITGIVVEFYMKDPERAPHWSVEGWKIEAGKPTRTLVYEMIGLDPKRRQKKQAGEGSSIDGNVTLSKPGSAASFDCNLQMSLVGHKGDIEWQPSSNSQTGTRLRWTDPTIAGVKLKVKGTGFVQWKFDRYIKLDQRGCDPDVSLNNSIGIFDLFDFRQGGMEKGGAGFIDVYLTKPEPDDRGRKGRPWKDEDKRPWTYEKTFELQLQPDKGGKLQREIGYPHCEITGFLPPVAEVFKAQSDLHLEIAILQVYRK